MTAVGDETEEVIVIDRLLVQISVYFQVPEWWGFQNDEGSRMHKHIPCVGEVYSFNLM